MQEAAFEMTHPRLILFAVVVALALTLAACGGGEDDAPDSTPTPPAASVSVPKLVSSLSDRTFSFSDGAVFGAALSGQEVDLTFGDLAGGEGPYTLRAGDEVAGGTVILGSCLLEVGGSTFPAGAGPQEGETIHLDPCVPDEGQLRVENTDNGVAARSTGSVSMERFAIDATWTTIQTMTATAGPGGETYASSQRQATTVTGRRTYNGRDLIEANIVVTEDGAEFRAIALLDPGNGIPVVILDEEGMQELQLTESDLMLPLTVGDTWTETSVSFLGCPTPEEDQEECIMETETTVTTYTVAAFEEVTTPAGAFVTLRIIDSEGFTINYDPVGRLLVRATGVRVDDDYRFESELDLVSYDW